MATTIPVTAQRYNDLRNTVNGLLEGYGQVGGTSVVTGDYNTNLDATNTVTAQQYEDLYLDIIKVKTHQVGEGAFSIDPFVIGDYDTNGPLTDKIELTYIQGLEALATDIQTDVYEIDVVGQAQVVDLKNPAGFSIHSTRRYSTSGTWNGTLNHIFEVTFNNADQRTEFFTAGGQIRFSASVDYTGAQAKTVDWQNELDSMGVISYKAIETISNNGVGTGTSIGDLQGLSSTYQVVYSKAGGASYARNDYRVYAQNINATQVRFKVEFNDNAPNDTTWGIDEAVFGDFTSTVELLQPVGAVTLGASTIPTVVIPDENLPTAVVTSNL